MKRKIRKKHLIAENEKHTLQRTALPKQAHIDKWLLEKKTGVK